MSWAEIKKAINSNISKSLDVLITEKANELQSKLNSVYNTVTVTGNIPSVKSVQRGYIKPIRNRDNPYWLEYNITINNINVDKSIVIINGGGYGSSLPSGTLKGISSTSITILISPAGNNANLSWEVIEFY